MSVVQVTTRLTLGLVCLSLSLWLLAGSLGLIPDNENVVAQGRAELCRTLATQCRYFVLRDDLEASEQLLSSVVGSSKDILSAALRKRDGSWHFATDDHDPQWHLEKAEPGQSTHMRCALRAEGRFWGWLELRFRPQAQQGIAALGWPPRLALLVFLGLANYSFFFVYLREMLRQLDPTKVIPPHIRSTLDTLAEGLLIVDVRERITLANRAFTEIVGQPATMVLRRQASAFCWYSLRGRDGDWPWTRAIRDGEPQIGEMLGIHHPETGQRILKVNASPILGDDGKHHGALVSFDDVTQMEKSRNELREMLESLRQSRDEIHRQNQELERLATRDPLTGCLNRRAFFGEVERSWSLAEQQSLPLSCMMLDIDHFKVINDTFGHRTGDRVLQGVADQLRARLRDADLLCRYGGEEFCIVMPRTHLDEAHRIAEAIRTAIAATDFGEPNVTVSVGLSDRSLGSEDAHELIHQADECLYVAKREGRNRSERFDTSQDKVVAARLENGVPATVLDPVAGLDESRDNAIPFHAVTALVSALAYRDRDTADHSRRVADLCVAVASGLMSATDSYILEIAALLHDIGKIGVPDSILLKPSALNDDEWHMMSRHERIGVEIIQSTFSNPKLAALIRTHHAWFGGNPRYPNLPTGNHIPLGARILAVADAYDAMVTDRVFRKGRSPEHAFAELRRCAVRQFDPAIVERLIETVQVRQAQGRHGTAATPRPAAIGFGTQVERLAAALEERDLSGIATLARRLALTARKHQVPEIAALAEELATEMTGEPDLRHLVRVTAELLDLCRSAQRAYLEQAACRTQP